MAFCLLGTPLKYQLINKETQSAINPQIWSESKTNQARRDANAKIVVRFPFKTWLLLDYLLEYIVLQLHYACDGCVHSADEY